jgi:hypothetical protein
VIDILFWIFYTEERENPISGDSEFKNDIIIHFTCAINIIGKPEINTRKVLSIQFPEKKLGDRGFQRKGLRERHRDNDEALHILLYNLHTFLYTLLKEAIDNYLTEPKTRALLTRYFYDYLNVNFEPNVQGEENYTVDTLNTEIDKIVIFFPND